MIIDDGLVAHIRAATKRAIFRAPGEVEDTAHEVRLAIVWGAALYLLLVFVMGVA